MSFNFKWPTFSDEFHASAAQMLNSALNRGPKPKVIADDILVEELGMGTIPPELEILEIGDLGTDRFRGIFRLTYAGDAHLVLKTKVQANPLSKPNRPDIGLFPSSNASRGILFAAAPLIVPMHLRLSSVKLRAIVVLVVSKAKGITLVFKNDPLESVEVSSTFDSVAVIQKYLQQEIEGQLREMFREDLPGIIHRLSQKWLSGEVKSEKEKSKHKSEAESQPNRTREPTLTRSTSEPLAVLETASTPGGTPKRSHSKGRKSQHGKSGGSVADLSASPTRSPPKPRASLRRSRHVAKAASTSAALLHNELPATHASTLDAAFPDIENYDPTYGLRPDDLPTHSGFSGLGRLAQRGLGGLKDLTASPTLEQPQHTAQDGSDIDLDGAAVFEDFDRNSHDVFSEDEQERDAVGNSHDGHHTDDGVTTDSDQEASDEMADDVSDLDAEEQSEVVDTSIDYTRFGYPPASAAFSDTHELNRASSIIFDDEPQAPAKRGKRGSVSGRPTSATRRISSSRSERSNISHTQRRKAEPEVVYETIPAVGGGTVTRPRVYHIASKVQPPEVDWDDEDTARPSQYGGTPSTRTGATRFGSDYGSATMGAQSSRTNTVRGMHDSPRLGAAFVSRDSSDESLLDLPPESYHSSDASHQQALDAGRSSVSGSDSRISMSHAGPASTSRESSYRDLSSQDLHWNHSAASTAPTSSRSQQWDPRNDVAHRAANAHTESDEQSNSGIKFRRNKSANHQRSKTMGGSDRAGFLPHRAGEGPGLAATPARNRASASRPGFITYATSPPGESSHWQQSPPHRASSDRDAAFSTSPNGAQEMLSISPFRDSSLHHGSPRGASNITGAFASASNSPQTAGPSKGAQGTGAAPTRLSIDASAHFLDLVKSNHTLSPFTRNMEHFTVRSAPVTPGWQTLSGSASVVGSSAASGTGTTSGSSQTGTKHGKAIAANATSHKHAAGSQTGSEHRHQRETDSSVPSSTLPARRRRTFQLGSSTKQDDAASASSGSRPSMDYREGSPSSVDVASSDEYGFARYAGSGPRPFKAPSSSTSSVADSSKGNRSGIKDARRRSRPDSMGPPSEAARLSALRWEAIRE